MRPQASHLSHQTASRRAAPRRASRLRIMLLATSALASAVLPTTLAHADPVNATWLPNPPTGDFNDGANWTGGAFPNADGTATFNASHGLKDIKFSQNTDLGGMTVASG